MELYLWKINQLAGHFISLYCIAMASTCVLLHTNQTWNVSKPFCYSFVA